jgi:hypothetical protein
MSKATEVADVLVADQLAAALQEKQQTRAQAHSVELREVLALEQIADELTALRVHVVASAQQKKG